MKLLKIACGLVLGFSLVACSETSPASAPPPPATTPAAPLPTLTPKEPASEPTVALAETPTETPVAPAEPTAEAISEVSAVDWLTVEGTTENNLTYQGNPEAPITMIDYSDFL